MTRPIRCHSRHPSWAVPISATHEDDVENGDEQPLQGDDVPIVIYDILTAIDNDGEDGMSLVLVT